MIFPMNPNADPVYPTPPHPVLVTSRHISFPPGTLLRAVFIALFLVIAACTGSTQAEVGGTSAEPKTPSSAPASSEPTPLLDANSSNPVGSPALNQPDAPDAAKTITLDLSKTLGKLDPAAFGLTLEPIRQNEPNPNFFLRSADGQNQLKALGVNSLFYFTDRNRWNALYDDFNALPLTSPDAFTTDEFLALSGGIGADPVVAVNITITCSQADPSQPPSTANVNCVNATPSLAQDWIKYINQTSQGTPKVKYVAMGVEPYAGCRYWKVAAKLNCTPNVPAGQHKILLPATEYASRVNQWAKAIHQIDPSVKIGVQLQPNTFECSTATCTTPWDQTVLTNAGSNIDFVMVHQYFVIKNPVTDQTNALKYSYYQEQQDLRLSKNGATALPSQIRLELSKWLPNKKSIPIFTTEFNASMNSKGTLDQQIETRQSLYAGFAVAELFMDMLQPVNVNGTLLPGNSRVFLHYLYDPSTMLALFQPQGANAPTMIYTPAWHIISALKDFRNKAILSPVIAGNPNTTVGRGALKVYAVKSGKDVWLAVFNHDPAKSIKFDIKLVGTSPASATVTQIGAQTTISLLTQNDLSNPTAISPATSTVPAGQLKPGAIVNFVFPAHSLTVISIKGQ